MKTNKPTIGITGPDKGGTAAWWFTKYAVLLQGGKPVRITPSKPNSDVKLDGLILGGGADIGPERYGESFAENPFEMGPKPSSLYQGFIKVLSFLFYPFLFLIRKLLSTKSSAVDPERDRLEFEILQRSINNTIPILGICRGSQLINVHFGGNLHQDIENFYSEVPRVHSIWPKKKVRIESDSKLGQIIGKDDIWVNALHNQAVDNKGSGLRVIAREETDLPQAIEHISYPFMLGVQWHPEYMPQIVHQRAIFSALVCQARKSVK